MADEHGRDPRSLHAHLYGAVRGQQRHVRLAVDEPLLAVVFIVRRRLRIPGLRVAEFADHAAQHRVASRFDISAQMYTHLRTVVPAQHGTVVDQRHAAAPFAGGAHSGAHARNASADHHEVETLLARSNRSGRLTTERRKRFAAGGRHIAGTVGEVYGVTAAVETRQVLERQRSPPLAEPDLTGALPLPAAARIADGRCEQLTPDADAELPGSGL